MPRPRPNLRLLDRRTTTLSAAVNPARSQYSWLIDAVAAWAFQQGRAHDSNYLALVLAARTEIPWLENSSLTYWTKDLVHQVLSWEIAIWCSVRNVLEPERDRAVLEAFFDYLDDSKLLDPDSDPVPVLVEVVRCTCDPAEVVCGCEDEYYGPSHGDVMAPG